MSKQEQIILAYVALMKAQRTLKSIEKQVKRLDIQANIAHSKTSLKPKHYNNIGCSAITILNNYKSHATLFS